MQKQIDMVESFKMEHRDYMKNLIRSMDKLEKDFEASREIDNICSGEWCRAVELCFDELAKELYSISEPRWVSDDYSRTLRNMRRRLHDLYAQYRSIHTSQHH